jgi:predicted nucleotidyltransferase
MALYGSFARSTPTEESDVDLLVELARPLGYAFVALVEDLEQILGKKVDLATFETYQRSKSDPRRRHIVERIEKDLVYVQ